MTEKALRAHWALNACGLVPPDTCLPFDPAISEDAWRIETQDIGREMGLIVAHATRAKGSKGGAWFSSMCKGWPDTVFLADRGEMLVVEYKDADGKATPEQVRIILALDRMCGCTARIFGPSDWPTLQSMLRRLR